MPNWVPLALRSVPSFSGRDLMGRVSEMLERDRRLNALTTDQCLHPQLRR